jgi:diaminopimelate decarboxylase
MSFEYKNNELYAEGLSVEHIAKQVKTPAYIYSANKFRSNFSALKNAFGKFPVNICFAVKSNSNIAVLKLLKEQGAGADTVSAGEIQRAMLAGIAPEKIIFSGVGKTKKEIQFAVDNDIGQLNVESAEELAIINKIAKAKNKKVKVSIRINPDVDADTHEKITTGKKHNKFGIPWEEIEDLFEKSKKFDGVEIEGVATHIGSQITSLEPFKAAFMKVAGMVKKLNAKGFHIRRVDLGGGIGIRYNDEVTISLKEYANAIVELFEPLNVKIFLEPGRSISADAGILVTKVQFIKHADDKSFAIVDAGMNDFARVAVYDAYHEIIPVTKTGKENIYDIVGPVCESSDFFGKDRTLPKLKNGSLLALRDTGAYGASMSSNYNSRGLIPEILVDGNDLKIIRKRQSFKQMISLEKF